MRPRPAWLPDYLLPFLQADPVRVLRTVIAAESAGEIMDGKRAVGLVCRTRSELAWGWSTDIVIVCLQPKQFTALWRDWPIRKNACLEAFETSVSDSATAAAEVLDGLPDFTDAATHYFNPDLVLPSWASHLVLKRKIGHHDFYGFL